MSPIKSSELCVSMDKAERIICAGNWDTVARRGETTARWEERRAECVLICYSNGNRRGREGGKTPFPVCLLILSGRFSSSPPSSCRPPRFVTVLQYLRRFLTSFQLVCCVPKPISPLVTHTVIVFKTAYGVATTREFPHFGSTRSFLSFDLQSHLS